MSPTSESPFDKEIIAALKEVFDLLPADDVEVFKGVNSHDVLAVPGLAQCLMPIVLSHLDHLPASAPLHDTLPMDDADTETDLRLECATATMDRVALSLAEQTELLRPEAMNVHLLPIVQDRLEADLRQFLLDAAALGIAHMRLARVRSLASVKTMEAA